jgi:hypothetical protein
MFDELLDMTRDYVHTRLTYPANGAPRDIGIYNWRLQARDLATCEAPNPPVALSWIVWK